MTTRKELPDNRLPVADLQIDTVQTAANELILGASGHDARDYVIEWHFDFPMSRGALTELGRVMAQSELRVWRKPKRGLKRRRVPATTRRGTRKTL